MKVLLVEPKKSKKYHTTYPSMGLLKLAAYHKRRGDNIRLVSGSIDNEFAPDINQGLDARLLTEETVLWIRKLKVPVVRLAYDILGVRKALKWAIQLLKGVGIRGRRIIVYCLHNHDSDTPEDFLNRIRDLLDWGVVAYPMRYEPIEPRKKNTYISQNWTAEQLEMIARARRVIGYGGAFPPYEGLKKKILNAKNFEKAFELGPLQKGR